MRIRDMPDPVLQQPAIVIARDRDDIGLAQQAAGGIDAAHAVGNVARAQDDVHILAGKPFQRPRQTRVLGVDVPDHAGAPNRFADLVPVVHQPTLATVS